MKYLKLPSFLLLVLLLTSCHTTEVSLRHSKTYFIGHSAPEHQTNDTEARSLSNEARTALVVAHQTPVSSHDSSPLSSPLYQKENNALIEQPNHAEPNTPKARPILHEHHKKSAAELAPLSAKKISAKPNGFFSHIGRSFGIGALIFLATGLLFLLIGGPMALTLGAVAFAFGVVFLLIWLVLALLQVLFDVIL